MFVHLKKSFNKIFGKNILTFAFDTENEIFQLYTSKTFQFNCVMHVVLHWAIVVGFIITKGRIEIL